jgi:hypothetical protein
MCIIIVIMDVGEVIRIMDLMDQSLLPKTDSRVVSFNEWAFRVHIGVQQTPKFPGSQLIPISYLDSGSKKETRTQHQHFLPFVPLPS